MSSLPPKPNADSLLLRDLELRHQRLLLFSGQQHTALRKEFGAFWSHPPEGLSAAGREAVTAFCARVDALEREHTALQAGYNAALKVAEPHRLAVLRALDQGRIARATQGLDGLARPLRASAEVQAFLARSFATPARRETGALARGPASAPFTGFLQRLVAKVAITEELVLPGAARGAATAPTPAPRPPDPAVEKARQALQAAREYVSNVVHYLGGRLLLLQTAVEAIGLPGPKLAWPRVVERLPAVAEGAALGPGEADWLAPLAKLFFTDASATLRAQIAVQQWHGARGQLAEADVVAGKAEAVPPPVAARLLATVDVGKLRASAVPLLHLHRTFAGLYLLETLFPPPPEPKDRPTYRPSWEA